MYILQNAFRNIQRNRGRNILIGVIILVIIIATVVALMINNTTSGIIDDYKGRFASEVAMIPDMQKIRDKAMAEAGGGPVRMMAPSIPAEQYVEFGQSEHLQGSVYTSSAGVNSNDITAVDEHLGGGTSGPVIMGGASTSAPTQFMFSLLGNKFGDFTEGLREIAEGRMPENENEFIISTELADLNHISVGDTISFSSELTDPDRNILDTDYELTVVGTYYDATDVYPEGGRQNALTNRRNEILTTYETVVSTFIPEHRGITVNAKYYLKNPDMLDAFAAEVYAKGLDPIYDVTTDESSYNKIVGPVEGLKSISITFMIIVLIFGGIIIALMSSIAIRERKYEIGVLRAMGMKKHKVAFGLWSEMLMITCLCLVIGLGAGTLIAQPVTNVLLDHQIEAAVAANAQPAFTGGMMGIGGSNAFSANADADPLKDIDITLGLITMLQIIAIALLLASFAGLVSISKITKYEPIKILMERN